MKKLFFFLALIGSLYSLKAQQTMSKSLTAKINKMITVKINEIIKKKVDSIVTAKMDSIYKNSKPIADVDVAVVDWNKDGILDYIKAVKVYGESYATTYVYYGRVDLEVRNKGDPIDKLYYLEKTPLGTNSGVKINIVDWNGDHLNDYLISGLAKDNKRAVTYVYYGRVDLEVRNKGDPVDKVYYLEKTPLHPKN